MFFKLSVFVICLAFLESSFGQIVSDGRCPVVSGQSNFSAARYAGLWYEVHRYEVDFQRGGECVTAEYTPQSNGSITVVNSMVLQGSRFTIQGFAVPNPSAGGKGELLVSFPTPGNVPSDYIVLTSDYTSYSLVYSCMNLPNNSSRSVMSWILSRKPTLSPSSVLAINEKVEAIDTLFWQNYRETKHTEQACNAW